LVENRHKGHLRFPFYLFRTKLVSMEDSFQFLTVLSSQYNLKIALNNNHSLTSPSIYYLWNCEFESRSWRGVLDTTSCDKVCQWLATGLWFSPVTPVSSTNKTDRHDITEILLKVALITINHTNQTKVKLVTFEDNFQFLTILSSWHNLKIANTWR
jgi:hypothetical protein